MKIFKYGITKLAIILCAVTVLCLLGSALANVTKKEIMPEHDVLTELQTEMQAVSIKDVAGCKEITTFNIVKGEFISNMMPQDAVYSHDINDLGQRGTIQILIENLDPLAEDFDAQAEKLSHLKVENSYKFSLHIPQVLASSIVYLNAQFLSETGAIEGYEFINYMNRNDVSEAHQSKTEPLTLDITMNAERKYMGQNSPLRNGALITIHYEAPEGKVAVLDGDVLIGDRESVDKAVAQNSMSLYLVQILAIASLAMLIFVTILKKRVEFFPQILYLLGISGLYTTYVIYNSSCDRPYLVLALGALFTSLVALGISMSVKKKLSFFPSRIVLCALALVLCVCSFALPLLSGGAVSTVAKIINILQYIIFISSALLMIYETLIGEKIKLKLGGFAALVFLALCIFDDLGLYFFSPVFGISLVLLIITVYTAMHEFVLIEKRNKYLTDNLEAEVERQTESLTHMIGEREDLLRYISHDLRKPVSGIRKLLPALSANDEAAAKTALENVESKLNTVENALSEISKYSKTNYHAEQSSVLSLDTVLQKIHNDLESDCNANGVHLRIKYSGFDVFAKPKALFSILSNLIFNALEHSGCDTIEIYAEKYEKKRCKIVVSDNGKGAANTATLFSPYNTTYDEESNTGLGLYISKQFALSMGGELIYQRDGELTKFSIILPII